MKNIQLNVIRTNNLLFLHYNDEIKQSQLKSFSVQTQNRMKYRSLEYKKQKRRHTHAQLATIVLIKIWLHRKKKNMNKYMKSEVLSYFD